MPRHTNIPEQLERILHELAEIWRFLHQPDAIHMHFKDSTMPVTIAVNQKVTATASETAKGISVPFKTNNLTWEASDPTVASVVTNPDGSATYTGLKTGSITAKVTDSSNGLTVSDSLTVGDGTGGGTGAADKIEIVWGTPQ